VSKEVSAKQPDTAVASVIFTYSIEHLTKTDKVRFYYALKGRDGKSGVAVKWNIEQLGRAVLLVKDTHEKEVREFLAFWKCNIQSKRVWVVP
jgi:hypothetical protein